MNGTLIRLRWTKKEGSNIILYISIVKMLWNGILISEVIMFSDFRAFEICNELYKYKWMEFWTMYNMPAILANNVCRKLEIVTYLYLFIYLFFASLFDIKLINQWIHLLADSYTNKRMYQAYDGCLRVYRKGFLYFSFWLKSVFLKNEEK